MDDHQDEESEEVLSRKLRNLQLELFKTLDTGNISLIKEHLDSAENVEGIINAEDDFKQTPLGVAIKAWDEELMKLLMAHGAEHGDGMLTAVDMRFIPGIKLLHNSERTLVNLAVVSSHFQFGTTPLMIACHKNDYELIELLFSLGAFPIETDLSIFGGDGLQRSLGRLLVYRAVCSAAYIMITYQDPLYQAFRRRSEVQKLSEIDENFSLQYEKLVTSLDKFGTEYLSCVSTDKELQCLMSMDSPNIDGDLSPPSGPVTRILYAINSSQKPFVAHRFCQQAIDEAFTQTIPWRGKGVFTKMVTATFALILLPIFWTLNILLPPSCLNFTFIKWFDVPLMKFISSLCGYMILVVMTALNCINLKGCTPKEGQTSCGEHDGLVSSYGEWICNIYVFFWLVGRLVEMLTQWIKVGFSSLWGDPWNHYDVLTIVLFTLSSMVYWSGGSNDTSGYGSLHDPQVQLYEICFSLGTLLVINRSIYWVGVMESLGRLNVLLSFALGVIVRFFLIFFIFHFSFAIAINSLLWKENYNFAASCLVSFRILY